MNILLLGAGGREHALAWKLAGSSLCYSLFIAPGNADTAECGTNVDLSPMDFEGIRKFCTKQDIGLVVVGPEEPLVKGIVDFFAADAVLQKIPVIGPSAKGALLEGSKAFSKRFMERHNIPTAGYREFDTGNSAEGIAYLQQHSLPIVLKADGLAAGKGVVICQNHIEAVAEFAEPAVAIIKHANPCGVATGSDLASAYRRAFACDTVSAFGGIIAVNRELDAETAELISQVFSEVIIAPKVNAEAQSVLARKKNLRVLETGGLPDPAAAGLAIKTLAGGFLAQSRDNGRVDPAALKVVTKRAPTPAELADLIFAMRVAKHVKSNAIVYAKAGATVGIGAGQMSRVDSSRIAAWKAAEAAKAAGDATSWAKGSVVASDAFFPFADGLLAAAEAGATAVIQPGGSMRDEDVIAAADQAGLAMVVTGTRHFRH